MVRNQTLRDMDDPPTVAELLAGIVRLPFVLLTLAFGGLHDRMGSAQRRARAGK